MRYNVEIPDFARNDNRHVQSVAGWIPDNAHSIAGHAISAEDSGHYSDSD